MLIFVSNHVTKNHYVICQRHVGGQPDSQDGCHTEYPGRKHAVFRLFCGSRWPSKFKIWEKVSVRGFNTYSLKSSDYKENVELIIMRVI